MGLISDDELAAEGLSGEARRRRRKDGALIPVLPGVYRLPGVEESWPQFARATSVWLRDRGALSHTTSACLQRILPEERWPIHVLSTQASLKSPSPRIVVHRVRILESRDLRWFEGMRITNAVRTVFDLAGLLAENAFDFALDQARRRQLVAERPLREALDRLGASGRPGSRVLRSVLRSGEMQRPVPGSPFERRFLHFARSRTLPQPERQYRICDADGVSMARVDFAYPEFKVAIECDSKKHHFGVVDWEHDVERRSRLAALGWLVIHVSWDMLVYEPDTVERLIRDALGSPALL